MANKFFSLIRSKAINWLNNDRPGQTTATIPSLDTGGLYCENVSYDNTFPNISRIAESFAEIPPYAIDANGKRLSQQPHLMEVLYSPNEEMSGPEFWETLITTMLVHPVVYLLAWRKKGKQLYAGGDITPDNIAGFTFMQGVGVSQVEGKTTYYYNGQTYNNREVLALSLNVNPYNLLAGYSPSMAAKKWANVDDYAADYQAGYFRNGAVPAGEFIVTAPSAEEFNKIVDSLQAQHRGASRSNNPIYVHRPTSSIDNRPMAAQVEWIPFTQASEKGTLQSIFDQANKKIDMTFGVPQEVKGYLQNSNYASAEVADYVFCKYVLYPKLRKVWAKMTHELNRVTGGMGFAISFDYEIPALTDTKKVQTETLVMLVNAGYTTESAVDALQLPSSFKKLSKDSKTVPGEQAPLNDVDDTPSNIEEAKAVKAKALDLGDGVQIEDDNDENPQLRAAIENYLNKILTAAINLAKEMLSSGASIDEIDQALKSQLERSGLIEETIRVVVSVITTIMLESGEAEAEELAQRLGLVNFHFSLSEEEMDKLNARITELITKFGYDTIARVIGVIRLGSEKDEEMIEEQLDALMVSEQYRVDRWVRSEQHTADETASIIAAIMASREADLVAWKTWKVDPTSPDMCIDCLAMDGETVRVDQLYSNGNLIPHYHPHCHCYSEYTFLPATKSVKITCPSCGRYMMESSGGSMKNVICANSKCKKHFDIQVHKGKITATEVKPQTD